MSLACHSTSNARQKKKAAFGMIFVLGSFIYSSIGEAKSIAASRRIKTHSDILEQRKRLGIDAWDQRKERERLRQASGSGLGGGLNE